MLLAGKQGGARGHGRSRSREEVAGRRGCQSCARLCPGFPGCSPTQASAGRRVLLACTITSSLADPWAQAKVTPVVGRGVVCQGGVAAPSTATAASTC